MVGSVNRTKARPTAVKNWLREVGTAVRKLRGEEKQEHFAKACGISRRTLTAIETGAHSYGIDALLLVLSYGKIEPVKELLERSFRSISVEQMEQHRQFQALLEAQGPTTIAAALLVESLWLKYRDERRKEAAGGGSRSKVK